MSKRQTKRNKPRLQFTLSKEVAEKLREKATNMSAFVDKTLREVLLQEPSEIVSIIPKRSGPREIRTPDLRRVKATS